MGKKSNLLDGYIFAELFETNFSAFVDKVTDVGPEALRDLSYFESEARYFTTTSQYHNFNESYNVLPIKTKIAYFSYCFKNL